MSRGPRAHVRLHNTPDSHAVVITHGIAASHVSPLLAHKECRGRERCVSCPPTTPCSWCSTRISPRRCRSCALSLSPRHTCLFGSLMPFPNTSPLRGRPRAAKFSFGNLKVCPARGSRGHTAAPRPHHRRSPQFAWGSSSIPPAFMTFTFHPGLCVHCFSLFWRLLCKVMQLRGFVA